MCGFFLQKNFICDIIILVIDLNVYYELGDLKFEWDSEKAEINFKKHGVKFRNAALAFFDENLIVDYDDFHSDDEERYKIIGKVEKILVVIYTERSDRNRIISARLANKRERSDYYEQFYY